jgi:deoxyribodipyrimidine photo-lyase
MANKLKLPLLAVYGLYERFPEANERCFSFLIGGLVDLRAALTARGVKLVLLRCPPPDAALRLGKQAALIVCDCG